MVQGVGILVGNATKMDWKNFQNTVANFVIPRNTHGQNKIDAIKVGKHLKLIDRKIFIALDMSNKALKDICNKIESHLILGRGDPKLIIKLGTKSKFSLLNISIIDWNRLSAKQKKIL